MRSPQTHMNEIPTGRAAAADSEGVAAAAPAAETESAAQPVIKIYAAAGNVNDIRPRSVSELLAITEKFDDRGTDYQLEYQSPTTENLNR